MHKLKVKHLSTSPHYLLEVHGIAAQHMLFIIFTRLPTCLFVLSLCKSGHLVCIDPALIKMWFHLCVCAALTGKSTHSRSIICHLCWSLYFSAVKYLIPHTPWLFLLLISLPSHILDFKPFLLLSALLLPSYPSLFQPFFLPWETICNHTHTLTVPLSIPCRHACRRIMDGWTGMTDGVNGGADGLKWPFHEQTATSRKKNMAPVFFFFCHVHVFSVTPWLICTSPVNYLSLCLSAYLSSIRGRADAFRCEM